MMQAYGPNNSGDGTPHHHIFHSDFSEMGPTPRKSYGSFRKLENAAVSFERLDDGSLLLVQILAKLKISTASIYVYITLLAHSLIEYSENYPNISCAVSLIEAVYAS